MFIKVALHCTQQQNPRILIKDRNGMDLTEAEDIKKRWQEYTELSPLPRQSQWCDHSHSPRARHPGM